MTFKNCNLLNFPKKKARDFCLEIQAAVPYQWHQTHLKLVAIDDSSHKHWSPKTTQNHCTRSVWNPRVSQMVTVLTSHVPSIIRPSGSPTLYGCFRKWWYSQNTSKWSFLVGKPMVVGYHHCRKPPYRSILLGGIVMCIRHHKTYIYIYFMIYVSQAKLSELLLWILRTEPASNICSVSGL